MDSIQGLVGLRAAIGGGAWVAPNFAAKLFLLDPDDNPQLPYIGRLFGIRDLVLALGLANSHGTARRDWLRAGLVCDLADTAAALLGARDGYLGKLTTAAVLAGSLSGTALGVKALGEPAAQ